MRKEGIEHEERGRKWERGEGKEGRGGTPQIFTDCYAFNYQINRTKLTPLPGANHG